ncbi:MAG: glycosyltransferase family 4 protein [Methylacidiphilales bacterium]|nr:glycosyltransferase family 4 protein [Candidatus Methylacidiphilales bacterium]
MSRKLKYLYLGGANVGGTYRVFLNLQRAVGQRGMDLQIETAADLVRAVSRREQIDAARALVGRLKDTDGVIVNVFMAPALMNVVRYLPPEFPRVMVVHTITHATYRAARALRDHVHATIGVSFRIRDDLVRRFGFDASRTHAVFNAVDPDSTADPNAPRPLNAVLSLGRLEDGSKGILQLPRIFDGEASRLGALSIAGDGPDRERLEEAYRRVGVAPNFLGLVQPSDVASIYARHSIFLFPSRYEGMGLALAEAMASGLVPIAARIRGVTDVIIEDGVSGYVFEQGDLKTAHARLLELLRDEARLTSMRVAAAERARALFSPERFAETYDAILRQVANAPFPVRSLPVERWSIPSGMQPGLRSVLPERLRAASAISC